MGTGKPVTASGITLAGASAGNYTVPATATTTANITKAPLTVTANNLSRVYGAANPTLTTTITGFVNGETAAVLTGSPATSTTATVASPVGTYPITVTQGTLASANYSFGFVNGTLTVTQVVYPTAITITAIITIMITTMIMARNCPRRLFGCVRLKPFCLPKAMSIPTRLI